MATPPGGAAQWQFEYLWRYGALVLLVLGLALLGIGISGIQGEAISVTLIPLGLGSVVAGVILPRTEGNFRIGSGGVAGNLRSIHDLDFTISEPAVELREVKVAEGISAVEAVQPAGAITLGDVWDALDAVNVKSRRGDPAALNQKATFEGVGLGSAYFRLDDGRQLKMPNRGFFDHGAATVELLSLLATWGIQPTASGRYPIPEALKQRFLEAPVFINPPPEGSQ
jgi:hypothetical protein